MSVDHDSRSETTTGGKAERHRGGSHRAENTGPSPLLAGLIGIVLVVAGIALAVIVLDGSDDRLQQAADATDGTSGQTSPRAQTASSAENGASGGGQGSPSGTLAAEPDSRSAGRSLAANDRLDFAQRERAELREGRVDIRVLALLALLSADYRLEVADFAAPGFGAGLRTAFVVDVAGVDGQSVDSRAGQELAAVARDQRGVYRPREVTVGDGIIRIAFAPRDSDDLPPVPIP